MACVYVSRVTRQEARRSNSWATLISAPLARNSVAQVWRNVCHPIFLVMPARRATSRIRFLISDWYQYGLRPPLYGLAKTQSLAALYFVRARQVRSVLARSGSS